MSAYGNGDSQIARKHPRANIYDVARAAGVSIATVSRALNGGSSVAPEIAQRVASATERLGYIPARAAQNLSSRRSRMLAAILPTLDYSIYARKIEALRLRASSLRYGLLIATSNRDLDTEYAQCVDLIRSGAEGIMLEGGEHRPALFERLRQHGVCYVNTSVYAPDSEHPTIGFRNEDIGARAAGHLLDLGHRIIGVVAGPLHDKNDRLTGRVVGVARALRERGSSLADNHVVKCGYSVGDARQALRHLMSQTPRPSAVVCGNDVLALGAFLEAQHAGIDIPRELSMIGFDDLDWAAHLKPGLTTFYVPTAEIGTRSAEYLVSSIEGRATFHHQELDVPLILRGSTGPYTA
jgi:LacI family transcriptional regulator